MKIKHLAAAVAAVSVLGASSAQAETVETLATGLDNPRGVTIAQDGTVYVALAGRGGRACEGSGETAQCFGMSGRIARFKDGVLSTQSRSFASLAGPEGTFAQGVHGVSLAPNGGLYAVTGSAPPEGVRALPKAARRQVGRLWDVGRPKPGVLTRVDELEWKRNFDKVRGDVNSNPYAVLGENFRVLIVDAGANAIYEYRGERTRLFSVIPKNGRGQAVPSSIARGPDGDIYVGELAESAGAGKARVFRIPEEGGKAKVAARGFTNISGLAFGPDGSMFVTELGLASGTLQGDVVRVAPGGTRTTLGAGKLLAPQGAAVDSSGAVYVSTGSVLPRSAAADSTFAGANGALTKITP